MINQAPIVRYRASVCEIFFSDFRKKTFSAESNLWGEACVIDLFDPQSCQFASRGSVWNQVLQAHICRKPNGKTCRVGPRQPLGLTTQGSVKGIAYGKCLEGQFLGRKGGL
jgi:hypothetical protein